MIDTWTWDHSPFTHVRGTLTTGQIYWTGCRPEVTKSVPKGGPGRDTCIRC